MDGQMDVSAGSEAMALLDAVRKDAAQNDGPSALPPDIDELRDDGTTSPDDVAAPNADAEAKQPEAPASDYIEIPGTEGEQPTRLPIAEAVEAVQRWNEIKDRADQVYAAVHNEAMTHARGWLSQQQEAVQAFGAQWQALMQVMSPPTKPSASMIREQGYDAYAEAMERYEQGAALWSQMQHRGQQLFQHVQTQQAQLADQVTEVELGRLVRQWPEMGDPTKALALRNDLVSNLTRYYGFDEATLDAINDHRYFLVARDALAYRAMQKGAQPTPQPKQQDAKPAPKLVRTQTQGQSAQERGAGGKFVSGAAARLASEKSDAAAVDFFRAQIRSGRIK